MADLKLAILKQDLHIMTDRLDEYLKTLLSAAAGMIAREGVTLTASEEDTMLVVMYAAWMYRKRNPSDNRVAPQMPRMLRYALNNRLLSEKMGGPKNSASGDCDG